MKKFCTACGNVGNPVLVKKGSTGTAFLLWITFLLPGIIYSIWRANSEHEACAACGGSQVIPVDSPMSRKLMGDDYQKMKDEEAKAIAAAVAARRAAKLEAEQAERRRMALPWWKRNFGTVLVAFICVAFATMVVVLTIKYPPAATDPATTVAAPAPSPCSESTAPGCEEPAAQKPKPAAKHKAKARVEAKAVNSEAEEEAEAGSWRTQKGCEGDGFVWHDDTGDCQTK